mmetsp:Transcript_1195/g.3466  ORF Transcript_1195/g.3466 Transcript_1195/m.3466 type:complete len:249 (+) Transcript_1195:115-861(+)
MPPCSSASRDLTAISKSVSTSKRSCARWTSCCSLIARSTTLAARRTSVPTPTPPIPTASPNSRTISFSNRARTDSSWSPKVCIARAAKRIPWCAIAIACAMRIGGPRTPIPTVRTMTTTTTMRRMRTTPTPANVADAMAKASTWERRNARKIFVDSASVSTTMNMDASSVAAVRDAQRTRGILGWRNCVHRLQRNRRALRLPCQPSCHARSNWRKNQRLRCRRRQRERRLCKASARLNWVTMIMDCFP